MPKWPSEPHAARDGLIVLSAMQRSLTMISRRLMKWSLPARNARKYSERTWGTLHLAIIISFSFCFKYYPLLSFFPFFYLFICINFYLLLSLPVNFSVIFISTICLLPLLWLNVYLLLVDWMSKWVLILLTESLKSPMSSVQDVVWFLYFVWSFILSSLSLLYSLLFFSFSSILCFSISIFCSFILFISFLKSAHIVLHCTN